MVDLRSSIDTRPIDLHGLLEGIDKGTIVLPDFQRDFDWSKGNTTSLLATMLCGWPAGSLLLMNGSPKFFATRAFDGAPPRAPKVRFVVLDGQQRLTALYRAIRRAGPEIYAVRLHDLLAAGDVAEDVEDSIVSVPTNVWEDQYDIRRLQRDGLVPFYALADASDFFQFRDEMVRAAPAAEKEATGELLSRAYRAALGRLNHYDFPAVILEPGLPTAAVARIFERINRTGLRLSTFDLVVARVYEPGWNLRDRWDEARRESELLDRYLDDGLAVIQTMALRYASDVRQPAVLDLSAQLIRESWDAATSSVAAAFEFLERAGAIIPDWLPYPGMVLPLAALAWEQGAGVLDDYDHWLRSWMISRGLASAYESASSTRIVADYKALQGQEFDRDVIDPAQLAAATRRQQAAVWRSLMTILVGSGGREPIEGLPLTSYPSKELVPVSVFSKQSGLGVAAPHLRVLSAVLVSRQTAKALSGDGLASMLTTKGRNIEAVESQFLPRDSGERWLLDPEAFLFKRAEMIVAYVDAMFDN